LNNIDELERLPDDTLILCVNYILQGTSFSTEREFDESVEQIFRSNMDSWKNLNDMNFAQNTETFYKTRNWLNDMGAKFFVFNKPISREESFADLQTGILYGSKATFVSYLKKKLTDQRVQTYLKGYYQRSQTYRNLLEGWMRVSDENKFLMNITDEEMKQFVASTRRKVTPATDKTIVGTWVYHLDDNRSSENEFRSDHTFTACETLKVGYDVFRGKAIVTCTTEGKWNIDGDSITILIEPSSIKVKVDESGISYQETMRDSIQSLLSQIHESALQSFRQDAARDNGRRTKATNIDMTGKKLELTYAEGETTHFKRKTHSGVIRSRIV
jgi:hypothetical protein